MSKKIYKIPFQQFANNGQDYWAMMEYVTAKEGDVKVEGKTNYLVPDAWRDNCIFNARLKLDGQYRGRSAARVRVINESNGEHYSMGLASFYEAVVLFGATPGYIVGHWTFRKQGMNYSLFPAEIVHSQSSPVPEQLGVEVKQPVVIDTNPEPPLLTAYSGECWCKHCETQRLSKLEGLARIHRRRFIVCPDCGNKRCPKAQHHDRACTKSNATGQPGGG